MSTPSTGAIADLKAANDELIETQKEIMKETIRVAKEVEPDKAAQANARRIAGN